ncbi:MAG TPA: choice-of-anchor tandem repeat GloVer-containing protein, partial [Candidatus Tumulicola sp.]|nr:choice-of-anchor tandem repeat GloVer-containing protein [Candidatus Tumulicola sp.]
MKHLIGLAGACLSAALLTACGAPGNGVASSVPFSPHSSATANRVAEATVWQLFSFRGKSGELPYAGLTALNGTLYGTATAGGDKQLGVVFRITPTGEEKLLHAFRGGSDGAYPYGSLNDVRGSLYGTTVGGGADGAGTVFK